MPRNTRCVVPGLAYHVTQRGTNHQRVFFSAADRATYLRLLKQNLDPTQSRVLGWCLMTNHIHLVLVPGQINSLEVLLRRVHREVPVVVRKSETVVLRHPVMPVGSELSPVDRPIVTSPK